MHNHALSAAADGAAAGVTGATVARVPPVVEPWMTDAVATALRAVGCPVATAEHLAAQTRIEGVHGDWALLLIGHGCGIDVPVQRATWEYAAEVVAENVAASNAEAVDRSNRGEPDETVLWPLPDRRPRR